MAAPPVLWQHDVAQQAALSWPGSADAQRAAVNNASEEKISNTWAHIKRVTQEGVKEYDLLDLLMNTSREDVYLASPAGVSPSAAAPLVMQVYRGHCKHCRCHVHVQQAWPWPAAAEILLLLGVPCSGSFIELLPAKDLSKPCVVTMRPC